MNTFTTHFISPLGVLQITSSDASLLSIRFTESGVVNPPTDNLQPILKKCTSQLTEYFNGERKTFDLPLLQSGSLFQQKVWDLLYQIPFGKTISYQQLSKHYGDVKAIRAIASANGRNNLPIIVPCHRVIGSNQSLTGYSGGLWRKKWLLEHEAKWHSGLQVLF